MELATVSLVARLPLNVATADVRVALPPEQAVPASAQLLAAFGDIVEAEQGSFSALVCPGTLDNPVVVTFTLTPPAMDATEMVISVRAAAVEGFIKQRSAEALLPRVVTALEQLGSGAAVRYQQREPAHGALVGQ